MYCTDMQCKLSEIKGTKKHWNESIQSWELLIWITRCKLNIMDTVAICHILIFTAAILWSRLEFSRFLFIYLFPFLLIYLKRIRFLRNLLIFATLNRFYLHHLNRQVSLRDSASISSLLLMEMQSTLIYPKLERLH